MPLLQGKKSKKLISSGFTTCQYSRVITVDKVIDVLLGSTFMCKHEN